MREAIQKIQERTQSNRDINGRRFTRYSDEYAEFKGVGVNDVDLTFTGEMLETIESQNIRNNLVKVKVADDESPKAFNHNTGDSPGMPKRTFFGLKEKEARQIAQTITRPRTVGEALDEVGGLEAEIVDGEN